MSEETSNIVESSKIIAEALGWRRKSFPMHMKSPFHGQSIWLYSVGKTGQFASVVGQEHFHDSFEWIHHAIEIIEQGDYSVTISKESTSIESDDYDFYPDIKEAYSEEHTGSKISATFNAVVAFFTWVKKNNITV